MSSASESLGVLISTRVAVNAPSAFLAASALSHRHFEQISQADGSAREPLPHALFEALSARHKGSLSPFIAALAELDRDDAGPVAGFWVTLFRADSLLFPTAPMSRLADFTVERLPEPHRSPLVYAALPGSARDEAALRRETLAYWEAKDLIGACEPAPLAQRPPRL